MSKPKVTQLIMDNYNIQGVILEVDAMHEHLKFQPLFREKVLTVHYQSIENFPESIVIRGIECVVEGENE